MQTEIKITIKKKITIKNKIRSDSARSLLILIFFLILIRPIAAQETKTTPQPIDLPTAMRLAGAQNLDVQIAQARLAEANANHQSALAQFFPWISPGISYRQHDGKLQETSGNILDVHKNSYAPGATVGVQLDLGDAIYKSLAAKQLAQAAGHALDAQRQESVLLAVQGYFELTLAQVSVGVAQESVRIAGDYERELGQAVEAGLAFKGDLLRARLQVERDRLTLQQSREQKRVAAARLAQVLRLDPAVELVAQDSDLAPLTLIETNAALDTLVQRSLVSRPELRQSHSVTAAARDAQNGAIYGPLIPSIGAQGFWGGLGGGRRGAGDAFGGQQDYLVGVSWRIGPGGLFDFGRVRSAESRSKIAGLNHEKQRDEATREVVEAFTRWQSLANQLVTAQRALAAAEEGLMLAQQRKEFAVGVVLETIQAGQDLARTRLDYLKTAASFNSAQYTLRKFIGGL